MMKRVLFISHDASLTGAPILLLNLIKVLQKNKQFELKLIIKNDYGTLLQEFIDTVDTEVWRQSEKKVLSKGFASKVLKKLTKNKKDKKLQNWIDESDIIVFNTITNGDLFDIFDFSKVLHIVTYVHELEIAAGYFTTIKDLQNVIKLSNGFAVPADAVAIYLKNNFKISESRIFRLNYYIPFRNDIKTINEESKHSFIIGIAGTLDWRKGSDILSVIIKNVFTRYPDMNVTFFWKGVNRLSIEYKRIEYELKRTELLDKVIFEEPSDDMDEFYKRIDLLLLCSKEDPYPLVVLEAAAFKKPCVCFDHAGGAPEFVQSDAGTVVPYLDINAITEALYSYYTDETTIRAKGLNAYTRYKNEHCNELLTYSQFNRLLS